MDTRSYKVYRHKGLYFRYYNHWDSYPSGFGLEVLGEVPRDPEAFKQWLVDTKEFFDNQFDIKGFNDEDDGDALVITEVQPSNDIFIEWVYEIDLDHLVFLVDREPLYNLSCLPPEDIFLETIGFDHYGHRAYRKSTPEEYRYNWTAPPPVVDNSRLATYNANRNEPITLQPHELLGVPAFLSNCESVRIHLLELLLGTVMHTHCVGHFVRMLENVPARDGILPEMSDLALLMVKITTGPAIFKGDQRNCGHYSEALSEAFVWLRPNLCLRVTTHLRHERNMQAAVAELVEEVLAKDKTGVVYGIVFSIFDCILVSIDVDSGGSFKHTPVLKFLPSFYAGSPSTPGITALARLGCMLDRDPVSYMEQVLTTSFRNGSAISKVPLEIWQNIAWNLSAEDLVAMRNLPARCRQAAAEVLRYPHIGGYRLICSIPTVDDELNEGQEKDDSTARLSLVNGSFEAAFGGETGLVVEICPRRELDIDCITFGLCLQVDIRVPYHAVARE